MATSRSRTSRKKTPGKRFTLTRPTRSKLDPHLNFVLGRPLAQVKKQSRMERRERIERVGKLRDLDKLLAKAADDKQRTEIERQIADLVMEHPPSIVHGVFFPDDRELKSDAPSIRLRKPFISAFIKGQCNHRDLARLGIRVRNQVGDIFTAFVPVAVVRKLEGMAGIEAIEIARPLTIDLNNTLPYAQVSNLQGPPSNLTGNGVVVGILDTFLHFYHPDFRNNDAAGGDGQGSSRVLFLWDQLLTPQAGEAGPPNLPGFTPTGGTTYGVEYSQANINAELNNFGPPPAAGQPPATAAYQIVRHAGTNTGVGTAHGTHVAGIAAGNGRAQAGTFTGAAPGAGIIFVRNGSNNFVHGDSTVVADAFAYVFARAAQLGAPCVVNMSQSDNMGPHDGTTLGEQFLDGLVATPGRAVTLAAGNANNRGSHRTGTVAPGGTTTVTVVYAGNPTRNDIIQIWYDGHDRFNATLTIPTAPATIIGPIAPGATSAVANLPNGVQVQVVHTLNDARNNDNVISIFINNVGAGQPIPAGNWSLALAGATVINGAFDAWIDRNNRANRTWAAPVENQGTIAVPATGLRAISVGNHDRTAPSPGISGTSSAGPTRDGRIKPDIAAVGTNVTAPWYQLQNNAAPGVFYNAIGGTSMAAPLVAGTVALMFQCRGAGITWSDIKQLLQNTAGTPAGGVPSNAFGFGFLQAANLCATPDANVDVWIRDHSADTGVEPFTGGVTWLSPDIEVLDMLGNPVANPTHEPANFVNNIIRVTIRNRGTQTARNVEAYLYWGDPGTNIPFPSEWRDTGIYTGDPNFVVQSNKVVVPQVAAGASVQVRYAWAPPAPGANLRGDDHFCLMARLEHEDDESNVNTGGWTVIAGSNNIALRNTHVQLAAGGDGDNDTAFYATGTGDQDTLEIETENLDLPVELTVPVQALPWRELSRVNRWRVRRGPFGTDCPPDPLAGENRRLKGAEIELYTGVVGAQAAYIADGIAVLTGAGPRGFSIPDLRIAPGAKMPVRLRVRGAKVGRKPGFVHVRQRSGGKTVGGVTLELRARLPRTKRVRTRLEKGELVIE